MLQLTFSCGYIYSEDRLMFGFIMGTRTCCGQVQLLFHPSLVPHIAAQDSRIRTSCAHNPLITIENQTFSIVKSIPI